MVSTRVSPKRNIDFIIAGGASMGLGHVMRSASIAESAQRLSWTSRVFIQGDEAAIDGWRRVSHQSDVQDWSQWNARCPAPLSVIDFRGEKLDWLARLRSSRSRSVVLDDARYTGHADLTICPGLHHAFLSPSVESEHRLLHGPRYAILSEVHRSTTSRALGTRSRLLLSLGGADPHRLAPRVAPILDRVLEDSEVLHGIVSRHVVLGPAFADPTADVARGFARAGWQVHTALAPARMAQLMSEARLAVMGFGTSLTELAWHGTPHASLTHHQSDVGSAEALEAFGIGIHLGSAESLDDATVEARFRRALEDSDWQRQSARIAFDALDGGHGMTRILERFEDLAFGETTTSTHASSTKGFHVPSA